MPLNAPAPKSDYEPVPADTYIARCYSVVDLGTHEEEWKGQAKQSRKIRITWELPTEQKEFTNKDGEKKMLPLVIGKEYTLSMGEKANLRKIVEGMIGTKLDDIEASSFDVFELAGMECSLSVVHTTSKTSGKTFATIQGVNKLMKGTKCPSQVNPSVTFNVYEWKQDVYDNLPDFMRAKIDESFERKPKDEVDAIPF